MNQKVLDEVNARVPFVCERQAALQDHVCQGRITREHALLYAGKKIDEAWAIVLLCAYAHGVDQFQDIGILDKHINEWIAINRMNKKLEERFYRVNWKQKRAYLNSLYGGLKLFTE